MIENIIGPFLLAAAVKLASDLDLALRQRQFFPNLRVPVPSCCFNDCRSNELCADVALGKVLLVEDIDQGRFGVSSILEAVMRQKISTNARRVASIGSRNPAKRGSPGGGFLDFTSASSRQ